MHSDQPWEAMSEQQLLACASGCADTIRSAEVDLLQIAYQWAVVRGADRIDP